MYGVMRKSGRLLVCLTLTLALAGSMLAQPGRGGRRGGGQGDDEPQIKPYAEVITDDAVSDEGVIKVHRIGSKLFFEIPTAELNNEFLLVNRVAKNTDGAGYGGQKLGTRVVRWERKDDNILLREVKYNVVAEQAGPESLAVASANNDTIIRSFPVMAEGETESAVIDVTSLYTTDVFEMSAKNRLQARGMDSGRSFVEQALSFPTNVEVRASHTYTRPAEPGGGRAGRQGPGRGGRGRAGMRPGSATLVLHYSMVKLPENPMQPRLFDERVGYFSVRQTDYSRPEHQAAERRFITRWRLEKQDPSAALSDPVKPITYWIDPATPERWIPYMKKGVEVWQPAFAEAGFSNAIIARDAPSPEEDPEWHPEDARFSVIRWLPSTIQNASGPHVHDPRTGEILETDIQFYHNIQKLLTAWYFIQVGPLDPRAQKLPFPDELMGELLAYVVAHEVGHTLGFQHNMKASSQYSLKQIRDPEFVKTMGHVSTLMDYSRFNYVAQPEDGIPVEDLFPGIGPYDRWATMWGYKPIPGATNPDEEFETLNEWALVQDQKPWLRFTTPDAAGTDPQAQTEAVGDVDPVQATKLGLKNLRRVADMLLPATKQDGKNWTQLEDMYGSLLGQWSREMRHVAVLVGGFLTQQKHAGQEGVRFEAVPRARQAGAVQFLNANAFETPAFLINPEILRRIEPVGVLDRIRNAQRGILRALLNPARVLQLVEQEALDGDKAYAAVDFLNDLRSGIWRELGLQRVHIDPYRRNLQRVFLETLDGRLNGSAPPTNDARALFRGQLIELSADLDRALGKSADATTRHHLLDTRDQVGKILDPKVARSQAGGAATGPFGFDDTAFGDDPDICWPDFKILPDRRP